MNVRQVLPPDAIPSIDDPSYTDAYAGEPAELVVVLTDDAGEVPPRAYPIRILNFHEIANDVYAGDPVAVTWCPLCGSAVVYDRVVDGETLEFGVSGKLADDDLVMYDRQTDSEWKQSLGEAIAGAYEGTRLEMRPAAVMSVERFRERYPDGDFLAPAGGESEAAGEGHEMEMIDYEADPYADYFSSAGIGLDAHHGKAGREWDREDIHPKEPVLGLTVEHEALGFPFDRVEENGGVAHATVGGRDVVIFVTGEGIHAFANPGYSFEPAADEGFRADGTRWDGATGESDDGRTLERLPAQRLFAFSWQDDHGPASFWAPAVP